MRNSRRGREGARLIDCSIGEGKALTTWRFWHKMTTNDGISCIAWQAFAIGRMIEDGTKGTMATHARTGIDALLVDAGTRLGAIRVDNTLGATLHIGISKVFGHALAGGSLIAFLANGIQATRTGTTGLYNLNRSCGWVKRGTT